MNEWGAGPSARFIKFFREGSVSYLDDPAKWPILAERLRTAGEFCLDTETYGQPDRTSPQHRARVHCWSVGVLTPVESPRGFRKAAGCVLPRAALDCEPLRRVLEDPAVRKWAHNSPHDYHSLVNEGVRVAGLEDSLQWLRVAVPGLKDYGLKDAEQWALGYPPRPTFKQMVTYVGTETTVRRRAERGCICGKVPCRARVTTDWLREDGVWMPHLRVTWRVFSPTPREVEKRYAVTDFVPGHPRWASWIDYSLMDAVRGMELVDWIRRKKQREMRYPW